MKKNKLYIFLFVLLLSLSISASAFADWDTCELNSINTEKWQDLNDEIKQAFPLNVIQAAITLLDEMSNISPLSPSDLEIPLAFITIKPFGFMDEYVWFAETLMPIIRWFFLGGVLVSIAVFMIERVL